VKLLPTLIALLALAAPAQAAWRTEAVPSPDTLEIRSFGFDRGGRGLLAYEGFRDTKPKKFTAIAMRDPAAGWASRGDLPGITWGNVRLEHFGADRVLLAATRARQSEPLGRAEHALVVAFGRSDGTFGRLRPLDRDVDPPASAVNSRGLAAVAWTRTLTGRVRVTLRRPGGSFRAPVPLSPKHAGVPAVAVSERGDVLVAWYRKGAIEARIKRPGHGFGKRQRIGTTQLSVANLRAALSPAGRHALVGWGAMSTPQSEDAPFVFEHGAALYSGGWTSTRLDRVTVSQFNDGPLVIPAFDPQGRALLAWVGRRTAGNGKALRVIDFRHADAPLAEIPAPDAPINDFGVSPAGALAASWSEYGGHDGPFVAVAPAGGSFGEPTDLHAEGTTALPESAIAFDGETPFVAWPAITTGPRPTIRVATPE
jgi:hypothetical protein